MNDIDLSQYLVKPDEKSRQNLEDANQLTSPPYEQTEMDLDQYRIQPEESLGQYAGRQAIRLGSRAAETVLGLPGDALRLAEMGVLGGAEKLTGADLSGLRKGVRETAPFKVLPSSNDLRALQAHLTGGMTEPQPGTWEEDLDKVVNWATNLGLGGSGFLRAIGGAIGSVGAGKIAKELGGTETAEALTEIGMATLLHNVNPGVAERAKNRLYDLAENALPTGTVVPTVGYQSDLKSLKDRLQRGASTPSKNQVITQIDHLMNRASGGAIEISELTEAYRDLNEIASNKKLFGELGKTGEKALKKRLDKVKGTIDAQLESYGQYNPTFYENWKAGNRAHQAIESSKAGRNWIKTKLKYLPEKLLGSAALEAFLGNPAVAATAVIGGSTVYPALRAVETLHRFTRSPQLRKAYLEAAKAATQHNVPLFIKSIERLDKLDAKQKEEESYQD